MMRVAGVAIAAAGAIAWTLHAQQAKTFRSGVETVVVYATVVDRQGRPVEGLERSDFEIEDDGHPRDITTFSRGPQATTIDLVLDRSGSVAKQADQMKSAARGFVADLLPDDRAALATLTWDCLPFTAGQVALTTALESPLPNDAGSPIWSALERAMTTVEPESGRRAVLILTDGQNENVLFSGLPRAPVKACAPVNPDDVVPSQVIAHARQEGLLVYAVIVPTPTANDAPLRQIVADSGGTAWRIAPADSLALVFRAIADELHHQYLLGFEPNGFDGRVHTIDVKVKRPGVTVRARRNYVAAPTPLSAHEADELAFEARAPWPVLTDGDVRAATRTAAAVDEAAPSCTAAAVFGSPAETRASVVITVEGPTTRIERAAAEARARQVLFDPATVSADLRAPTVLVTARFDDNGDEPAPLTDLVVRGRGEQPIALAPISKGPLVRHDSTGTGGFEATFAMTDFKALPRNDVEVVAISAVGERRCRFLPSAVRMAR